MDKIKGLIDAPFTPFYENGEVNYEPIEAYAKLLVKNKELSVIEISEFSGFNNISNFNRKFKEIKKIFRIRFVVQFPFNFREF